MLDIQLDDQNIHCMLQYVCLHFEENIIIGKIFEAELFRVVRLLNFPQLGDSYV